MCVHHYAVMRKTDLGSSSITRCVGTTGYFEERQRPNYIPTDETSRVYMQGSLVRKQISFDSGHRAMDI
jgi:hypothetical protein